MLLIILKNRNELGKVRNVNDKQDAIRTINRFKEKGRFILAYLVDKNRLIGVKLSSQQKWSWE